MSDVYLNLRIYEDEIEMLGNDIREIVDHISALNGNADKQVGDEVITYLHQMYNDYQLERDPFEEDGTFEGIDLEANT